MANAAGAARLRGLGAIMLNLGLIAGGPSMAQSSSVTTYHNDAQRTGWNPLETTLSAATVGGGKFGLTKSVALDDQVDAQPLVVHNQTIAGRGVHDVVYVATDNNTVYAIDGANGAILASRNLGAPIPQSALPGQCGNNGPHVGVDSTPVISTAQGALYLVADTFENGGATFRIHALDLSTLADKVAPTVIAAQHRLTNGSSYSFDAATARQRAALLLSNGAVYAAFASYCDQSPDASRGWLLGWNAATLAPLAASALLNQLAQTPDNYFLTSIWMAGYGPAATPDGASILFATSNADPSGTTYRAKTNIAESLVRVAPDLTTVQGHFTPPGEASEDRSDNDFGAGGAMALPDQSGLTGRLAVAAGKAGTMFLVDRTTDKSLVSYKIGGCWCGPSYFTGADGVNRVVTSGGATAMVWRLNTPATGKATLTRERATDIANGQDPGFFTSISSNGTQAGSAVIWAVGRPTDSNPASVRLFAIDPATGGVIYSSVAGTWPNTGGDANIVPTVANGHVYVASDRELAIFGLGSSATSTEELAAARADTLALSAASPALDPGQHAVFGTVVGLADTLLTLRTRSGATLAVDLATAARSRDLDRPAVGRAILVIGRFGPDNPRTLMASSVQRAKSSPGLWRADR